MSNSYFDAVLHEWRKRMDAEVSQKKEHVASGNYASLEEYKRACGIIQGMEIAKDLMNEAIDEFDKR